VIKSRRIRWAEDVTRIGERRGAYKILVRKLVEKKPLERPRRRWENSIKTDLQEVESEERQHGLD
jgi:hypothetical protein